MYCSRWASHCPKCYEPFDNWWSDPKAMENVRRPPSAPGANGNNGGNGGNGGNSNKKPKSNGEQQQEVLQSIAKALLPLLAAIPPTARPQEVSQAIDALQKTQNPATPTVPSLRHESRLARDKVTRLEAESYRIKQHIVSLQGQITKANSSLLENQQEIAKQIIVADAAEKSYQEAMRVEIPSTAPSLAGEPPERSERSPPTVRKRDESADQEQQPSKTQCMDSEFPQWGDADALDADDDSTFQEYDNLRAENQRLQGLVDQYKSQYGHTSEAMLAEAAAAITKQAEVLSTSGSVNAMETTPGGSSASSAGSSVSR